MDVIKGYLKDVYSNNQIYLRSNTENIYHDGNLLSPMIDYIRGG